MTAKESSVEVQVQVQAQRPFQLRSSIQAPPSESALCHSITGLSLSLPLPLSFTRPCFSSL